MGECVRGVEEGQWGGGGGCFGCSVLVHGVCVSWGSGLWCVFGGDWINLVRMKSSLRFLCHWYGMTGAFGHICDKTGSFSI